MNKTILTLGTAMLFAFGSVTLIGCGNAERPGNEETQEPHGEDDGHHQPAVYQCPMQCEGDKIYAEVGKCPKCEMDLEEVGEHGHGHDSHGHEH